MPITMSGRNWLMRQTQSCTLTIRLASILPSGSSRGSGTTGSWPLSAGSAIRGPTTATSGRWTSGRRPPRPNPFRPAGSADGWMPPAATRCARSVSARYFPLGCGPKVHRSGAFDIQGNAVGGEIHRNDGRAWCRRLERHPCDGSGVRGLPRDPDHRYDVPVAEAIGHEAAVAGWPAGHGGRGSEGGGAYPGVLGAVERIRHPRGGTRDPAASTADPR